MRGTLKKTTRRSFGSVNLIIVECKKIKGKGEAGELEIVV